MHFVREAGGVLPPFRGMFPEDWHCIQGSSSGLNMVDSRLIILQRSKHCSQPRHPDQSAHPETATMEKKEYTFKEISNTLIAADVYYTKENAGSKSPIGLCHCLIGFQL